MDSIRFSAENREKQGLCPTFRNMKNITIGKCYMYTLLFITRGNIMNMQNGWGIADPKLPGE